MKLTNNINIFAGVCTLLLFSGCQTTSQKSGLKMFNTHYQSGQYGDAVGVQLQAKGSKANDPAKLLEVLQAGAALRADALRADAPTTDAPTTDAPTTDAPTAGSKLKASNALFDEAEEIIKQHNEKLLASKAASTVGATLVNDSVLDYGGYEYDGVMVNTYKALNLWMDGDADARVEFNRAVERQDRAKVRFAKLIANNKAKLDKQQTEESKKYGQNGPDIQKNIENQETQSLVYSNLPEFEAYADFVNPFTLYAAGLYFMSQGDLSKAENLLKEAHGIDQSVEVIDNDFHGIRDITNGAEKFVWVFLENGLGPELEQFRVDLPLFLLTDNVNYTGIALPRIKLRDQAFPHLTVQSGDVLASTEVVASMDRVVQTEFNKRYPMILSRAIASTLIKTYAQHLAQKELGDWGGIAVAIYQAATNSADTRIWTALPKNFQVARVPAPKDGQVTLRFPDGSNEVVQLKSGQSSLVYVKAVTSSLRPLVNVIEL
jgi:hypothetical protein